VPARRRYTDRPMSEYEFALFHALTVAFRELVRLGLRRDLREPPEGALEGLWPTEAYTFRMLAAFVPKSERDARMQSASGEASEGGGRGP